MGTFSKLKKALRTHLIFNSLDLNYQFKLYLNNFKKKKTKNRNNYNKETFLIQILKTN